MRETGQLDNARRLAQGFEGRTPLKTLGKLELNVDPLLVYWF